MIEIPLSKGFGVFRPEEETSNAGHSFGFGCLRARGCRYAGYAQENSTGGFGGQSNLLIGLILPKAKTAARRIASYARLPEGHRTTARPRRHDSGMN
jgi:hypothetical protein